RKSSPSKRIEPEAGRFRPMRCFRRVLFPLPLPPITTKISPRLTSKVRSSMIVVAPYAIVRSLTSIGEDSGLVISDPDESGKPIDDRIRHDDKSDAGNHGGCR